MQPQGISEKLPTSDENCLRRMLRIREGRQQASWLTVRRSLDGIQLGRMGMGDGSIQFQVRQKKGAVLGRTCRCLVHGREAYFV